MKLSYDERYVSFQEEVDAFLSTHWQKAKGGKAEGAGEYIKTFRRLATENGYLYRGIPKRFGGSEQAPDVIKAQIITQSFAAAGAPMEVSGIGMMMLVPTLLEVGTDAQKERFVEKTVLGQYKWAQGYSEPQAGSDLASLRSRAELVGDEWVINGHKIWTTRAHEANYMFALLRTEPDAPKHGGLSYILLDFNQPGVTVRPIKQINGGREFCEVFLDNVRTPADWIVGQRGEGWAVSKVNLKHERNSVGSSSRSLPIFHSLIKLAQTASINGRPAIENPRIRARLVAIEGYVKSQLWSGYYQLTKASCDEPVGTLGLVNKITTTNILQSIAETATEIIGEAGLKAPPPEDVRGSGPEKWLNQILGSLALSLAGGASNIQRNIIAERGLGLPRTGTGQ
ncbi:acyl-CoA dehydrogenase family protein [Pseudomonas sp. NFX224]|uniref:acyl-CoA dehydrogenase family protein n=1 Tax=Pseudomonas sp. NFX224 TaxID=3402862 RepID=UPI003AFB5031